MILTSLTITEEVLVTPEAEIPPKLIMEGLLIDILSETSEMVDKGKDPFAFSI